MSLSHLSDITKPSNLNPNFNTSQLVHGSGTQYLSMSGNTTGVVQNAATLLSFSTVVKQSANNKIVYNAGSFTIQDEGWYLITANIVYSSAANQNLNSFILGFAIDGINLVNSSSTLLSSQDVTNGVKPAVTASCIQYFPAGDFFTVQALQGYSVAPVTPQSYTCSVTLLNIKN